MWFWLVTLLTVLTYPLNCLLARPRSLRPRPAWKLTEPWGGAPEQLLHDAGPQPWPAETQVLRHVLPWASITLTWSWTMWPWTAWVANKLNVGAFTWLGHVVLRPEHSPRTLYHEAIHVMQQAAHPFLGPVGVAIGYVFDLLLWLSWRKLLTWERGHTPLAERIAYDLDGSGDGS